MRALVSSVVIGCVARVARVACVACLACVACGEEPEHVHDEGEDVPFAVEVLSFSPGEGAGFGQDRMPDVVLGPPVSSGSTSSGSLDVVSLGARGEIVLRLGLPLVDEEGPDLLVFENPFLVNTDAGPSTLPTAEPGEVAVSEDGETFVTFACAPEAAAPNGCAGYALVLGGEPTDPETAGGDAFDLADVGLSSASFVRITDKGPETGVGVSAGFDLDAIASVHSP
jgi:hypothetical protein